jgi:hypothetical protein
VLEGHLEQVGLEVVDAVDGLEDEVAVGVDPRLLLGDLAVVDEGLDEGVVLGELAQLAAAQEVGASAGFSSTSSPIRSWARCRAPATWASRSSSAPSGPGVGPSSRRRSWPMAVLLAMSPRAAPPTPSQTAMTWGPA